MILSNFTALLDSRGLNPKANGKGWQSRCPAHEDKTPSLSYSTGTDGRLLVNCFAGCDAAAITQALGITTADLFNGEKLTTQAPARIVKTYDYHDACGKLVFQVCRFEPKTFRQRRPDGKGGWLWNMQGVTRVLYRLPEITKAIARGRPIVACEGEKDVDAVAKLGMEATCNVAGAGKWLPEYSDTLTGADVVIVADKDDAGRKHAQLVAQSLFGIAKSIRMIELPDIGARKVKDAFDWIQAGGTQGELSALFDSLEPWKSSSDVEFFVKPDAEIHGEIISILTDRKLTETEKKTNIANAIVLALTERGKFFFHSERRDFDTAMFFDDRRKRLERVRSHSFLAWLSDWLRVNRADALFKFIVAQIETTALSGEQTTGIIPESFWAVKEGAVYLSNGDGQAVKITPGKVASADNGTDGVLFAAGRTLAPWKLTEPKDPFETCSIFRDANLSAAHGLDLLRLFVFSLPTAPASKPPVCIIGDVGSGKTRTAKATAEFYGVPFVANKVEDAGEDDFWVNMDAGGLFILDNADTRSKWLADCVANAATDGCTQRRKLYTNAETVTLRARAWLCLTSANPTFGNDAGLADRLQVIRMKRRTGETSDAKLTSEIIEHRDAGLSFIVKTLATALADTGETPPGLNSRHPDYAAFAVKIGRAIGRESESIAALRQAEQDKSAFCVENDSIGAALLAYLNQAETFTGTAGELREQLIETDKELAEKLSVKRLGKRLAALWPHLEKVLNAAKETDRKGFTVYTLKAKSAEYAEFQTRF